MYCGQLIGVGGGLLGGLVVKDTSTGGGKRWLISFPAYMPPFVFVCVCNSGK
jgi:hypothetical protein